MKITVLGQAITSFGELWQKSLSDLLVDAMVGAIKNANLEIKDIDAIFVANMSAGMAENQVHLGALASQLMGGNKPAMRVEGACASGSLAMLAGEYSLLAGQYKTVLVVGVEKMTDIDSALATKYLSGAAFYGQEYGSTFPGLYGLLAGAHMQKYGTTRDQLSAVAVKNHLHAFDNPNAQYHKKFSLDQISQSQLVADPLRLLDCSPITDGAAAVVLTTKEVKGLAKINGFGHGQDSLDLAGRQSMTSLEATKTAARLAYKMSNLSAQKIQVAEVHDCFTIAEILAYEDLEFVGAGEGGKLVATGKTTYGGQVVVNPSGGLKAGGHPVGATGVKQIAYLAKILAQGQFETALAHNVGGSGATSVVHILTNKHD